MGFNIFKLGSKKSEKENNNPSGRSRKITSENVQLGDDCDVREAEHAYSVPTASKKNFGPKSLPAFAPRNRHEFVKKQVFGGDHFYESNRHCPKKEFNGEFNFRANQSMQQKNNMNNSMFVQRHDALSSRDQNRTFEYGSDEQSPLTLRHFNNYHRENEKHDCMIAEEYENNDNSDLDGTVSHRHSSNISRVPNNKAPSHKQKHDLCEDLKELSDKCKYFKRKYREHKERSSRLEDKMTICMTKYHNINSQLHDTKSMYKHAQDKCIALEDRLKMVEAELEKQRQIYIYQSSTAGYKKANSVLKSGSIEKMSTLNGSEIHVNSGTNSISDFTNFHIHNQNGAQPNNVRFSVNQAIPSQHYATIDDESKKLRSQKEDKYYIEGTRDESVLKK